MNFIIPIFSRYGAIAIQFTLVVIIARQLSSEEAGTYFLVSGMVLSLYFMTGFGVPDGLVAVCPPLIAEGKQGAAKEILIDGIKLSFPSALLMPVILGGGIFLIADDFAISILAAIWLLGYCLIFISSQALIAIGAVRLGSFVFYSAINFFLCITTIPYLVFSEAPSIFGVFLFNALAGSAAGMIAFFWAIRSVLRLSDGGAGALQRHSLWRKGILMAFGRLIQSAIIWMPVWVAGFLLSKVDAANIGLASRLFGVVGAVIAAVRFSIRPKLAQLSAAGAWIEVELISRRIAFGATVLAILAFLGALAVGDILIPIVFGEQYHVVTGLLLIMLLASISESLGGPVDEVLKMSGHARIVFWLQIFSLIFMAALGCLLAIKIGSLGVCIAFFISFSLLYGGQILYLYRERKILALPLIRL